jgi:flagellin-like hook-associated protein FlgL
VSFVVLTKLKTLAQQYESAADDDQKAEYKAEFDSLKTKISKTLGNSKVDGKDIMQTTESIASVVLNPQGNSTLTMQFTNVSSSTDIDALELAAEEEGGGESGGEGGGTATSVVDQIDAEIENMLSYLSEAKAFDAIASQQLKLNDTIISSKEAVKSLITDIDEAAETSRMIDESVRQQAAVSMIAQANMSRQSVLKLYM